MEIKTIFIIQAFEMELVEGRLQDVCTIEVYAQNAKQALDKAKKYIEKKQYRISNIIEKND